MKVLLAKPAFARLLSSMVYFTYPIGAMLVAAMLERRGHDVSVFHDDVSNPNPIPPGTCEIGKVHRKPLDEECYLPFLKVLDDFQPDVVGISYCSVDVEAAHDFAAFARQRGIRTVAGGMHPSLLPHEEAEFFDAVVVGEGDSPAAAVAFEDPAAYLVTCPPVEDLDAVVADRKCVIGGERYAPFLVGTVQTQRGCPYKCCYCAAPTVFGTRVRMRDPGAVREEVESLPTRQGRIIDDSFGVVRKHGLAVCKELAKTGFRWVCDAALQNVDEELVDALLEGGCRRVNIGLESASARWRELSGKRVQPGEPERVLQMAQSRGLGLTCYFVIGFPGETSQELAATLGWARSLKERGAHPCVSVLTPYPGTRVMELTKELGPIIGDWSSRFHQSGTLAFAGCSEDEWNQVVSEANRLNR